MNWDHSVRFFALLALAVQWPFSVFIVNNNSIPLDQHINTARVYVHSDDWVYRREDAQPLSFYITPRRARPVRPCRARPVRVGWGVGPEVQVAGRPCTEGGGPRETNSDLVMSSYALI